MPWPPDESVCLSEAASLLRMSYGEAHRRAQAGRLPGAVKRRGRWRVRLAILKDWVDRGCPEPARAGGERPRG